MFVNDEMLRNALKAHKEPPKTARVAEKPKDEPMVAAEPEAAREAADAPMVEDPPVMTQGEFGL